MAPGTLCRSRVLLAGAWLFGCLQAASPIQYRIDNHLEACIEPIASQATWVRGLLVLELRYRARQPTSRCGCKSQGVAFASYAETPGGQRWLTNGSMTLAHNDLVSLPLTVDRDLLGSAPVVVSLGCEPPDWASGASGRAGVGAAAPGTSR